MEFNKVNKEIEAGERELASQKAKIPQAVAKPAKTDVAAPKNVDRDPAKEIKLVEKNIAQLDAQKRSINTQLPKVTDIEELDRLEKELISVTERLSAAEDLWSQLNDEIQEL